MKVSTKNMFFAALGLVLMLSGCEQEAVQTLPERNFQLVWSDEFEGAAGLAPDAANWDYDLGNGCPNLCGWGNGEFQVYTDNAENVALDGDGNLVITAIRNAGPNYTSARIKTENLFDQRYGRFEARIKTPTGPGIWPAFWMLGSDCADVGWPQCGEIDIMEQRGQESFITHGSVHGPGYSGGDAITKKFGLQDGRFDSDFYVYAVEWGEGYIDFFVDDNLYQRIEPVDAPGEWVYDHGNIQDDMKVVV
ncbi:MAG: glycoside hydrolase family 16 protein, partial [Bacteroidota bacterium]